MDRAGKGSLTSATALRKAHPPFPRIAEDPIFIPQEETASFVTGHSSLEDS
jgi:hypothetical protein